MNNHFELPDRDRNYNKDSRLMKEIKDELSKSKKCYVYGVPGVGKSSFAIELAHELSETHLSIWFDCATEAKVNASVQRLASSMNIQFDNLKETWAQIKKELSASITKGVLIILDNVEEFEHIKIISESLPKNFDMILTTRDQRLNLNIKHFQVNYFDKQKAKTYLKDNIRERKLTEEKIQKIIEMIKSSEDEVLPFDLKCLVAFLNENINMSIEDYLEQFESVDFMQEIINRFKKNEENAWELLAYISYMDGDFIHIDLLIDILKNKMLKTEIQRAVNKLKCLSFVDELNKGERIGIKTHRLIQEKTQTLIKQNQISLENFIRNILKTLSPIMESIEKDHANWKKCNKAYDHAVKLLDNIEIIEIKELISFIRNITDYQRKFMVDLNYSIEIEQKLLKKLTDDTESYEKQQTTSYNNIGNCYLSIGYFEEAIRYYNTNLEIIIKKLGENHPDMATSYNNIACCYDSKGDYEQALRYYNNSLEINLKTLGENHPHVAISYNNIGNCYHSIGDFEEAIRYYNTNLEIIIKKLGENHPDVATSYNNIGNCYHSIGDFEEAIRYYNNSLEIRLKTLGENHPHVATSYNNIGSCYDSKGDYEQALRFYNNSLEISLKTLGENHPDVATSYNNIGSCYDYKGDYDEALRSYNKSFKIRLKILGEDHPDVATSYDNLGQCYDNKGDYEEALRYYNKSLEIRFKKLGENHPDIATSYNNIACYYNRKGDYEEALSYYNESLEISFKKLGEFHPSVATMYNNIACCYVGKGDFEEALCFYNKSLEIKLKVFCENHPDVAISYNNIGLCYKSKGDYDEALRYYKKSLEISLKTLGDNHPNVAKSYNNIGLCYNSKGDYEEALQYLNKNLEIKLKLFGEYHPSVATSYKNICLCYYSKGDYEEALRYLNKSSEIIHSASNETTGPQ